MGVGEGEISYLTGGSVPECVARRQDTHGSLRGQRSIGKSSRSLFPGIHWIVSYCAVCVMLIVVLPA